MKSQSSMPCEVYLLTISKKVVQVAIQECYVLDCYGAKQNKDRLC